jgi:arylsulfatase A
MKTRFLLSAVIALTSVANAALVEKPNFVFIFCDNLGYGDIEPFGSKINRTPNLNRMAREGRKFTDFYVSSGVCTPSRASFLTGCYPRRLNMHQSEIIPPDYWPNSSRNRARPPTHVSVLWPVSSKGLHPDEITIAEVLKDRSYATMLVGKWHLGDQKPFLPTRQGFDRFFGIPYSEGMMARTGAEGKIPPLPLMENDTVIEAPADCNLLTQRYTERAIDYITENKDRPFFLYLAHAMPGSIPDAFGSPKFKGKNKNGPWSDKVEELDWSTGQILEAIRDLGISERTFVIWTSDNGAPKIAEGARGSNTPLAGWGYTTAEGGMRVPCIMWWPGTIPAGTVCGEVASTMDLMPSYARLAGGSEPKDRIIDGRDIRPLILGKSGAKSPHEAFFYYNMDQLQAVRSGKWKLYLPLENKRSSPFAYLGKTPASLFDLEADLSETTDLIGQHSGFVERLTRYAEKARADLGDMDSPGKGQRPAGHHPNPTPRLLAKAGE